MEWRQPDLPRLKKAKVTQFQREITATAFWDSEKIFLIDLKECNTAIIRECYIFLMYQLMDAIKENSKRSVLLHNNARAHIDSSSSSISNSINVSYSTTLL